MKVQTTQNEVLGNLFSERCGDGDEITSPEASCEEHQNTRTGVLPLSKKPSEDWSRHTEQGPCKLTKPGEGSNTQEEEGNTTKLGVPVCLEAENISVKEPSKFDCS